MTDSNGPETSNDAVDKQKHQLNSENDPKETSKFFGVRVEPMDPFDRSFHSHTAKNPLDVSYHKIFTRKPILKRRETKEYETKANELEFENSNMQFDCTVAAPIDRISKKDKKSVKWNVLHVREYDVTIGDNPCVSYGPPISLDWCYMNLGTIDVEEYESNRDPRRSMRQMMMNYYFRKNLLIYTCGLTKEEMKKAAKIVKKVRMGRAITNAMPTPIRLLEDMKESAVRKTKRALGRDKTRVYDI